MKFWKLAIALMLGFMTCCISWRKICTRYRASWLHVYTNIRKMLPWHPHPPLENQMDHNKWRCQTSIKELKIYKIDYFKDINLFINLQRVINRFFSPLNLLLMNPRVSRMLHYVWTLENHAWSQLKNCTNNSTSKQQLQQLQQQQLLLLYQNIMCM